MKYIHDFKGYHSINENVQVEEIPERSYAGETVPNLPFNGELKGERDKFMKKLTYICKKLNAKPEWMMINIAGESGFNPAAVNPNGGATGLIQFMPKTIAAYNDSHTNKALTTNDLKKMSALQQLDVVYAYYKQCMKEQGINSFTRPGDFFGLTFYPKIVKEPDTFKFPPNAVEQNKGFFARIGGITKADYYRYCQKIVDNPMEMRKSIKNFDSEGFFGQRSGADVDFFTGLTQELASLVGDILTNNPGAAAVENSETKS